MSSVYATEPATAGRVILETTDGPIEIHLWCRECPQTTRVFLQLCLDGFYDNMVFHRIVNNFLIQTGALRHESVPPTPSMSSPEVTAYRQAVEAPQALDRRSYETNSRIRFNHRGQVAMALGVEDKDDVEDLQPQFFITLDGDAPYLDGKHVVFGTVSGPTIFNALRIGRTETDEATHQPEDLPNATRIKSVKIVDNPLHQGLTPHSNPPWKVKPQAAAETDKPKKKKKKRKGKFDTNVLSFGAEFEEEDAPPSKVKKGMQSSHDLVESKILGKQVDEQVKEVVLNQADNDGDADGERPPGKKSAKKLQRDREEEEVHDSSNRRLVEFSSRKHRQEEKCEEPNSKKSDGDEEKPSKDSEETSNKPAPKQSLVESRRLKYAKGKKSKKEREEETLNKLMAFRSTVQTKVEERKSSKDRGSSWTLQKDNSLASRMARKADKANGKHDNLKKGVEAPTYYGQILDSDEENNAEEGGDRKSKWLGTSFKCRRHVDHASRDLGGDGRNADDYEVVDSKRGGRDKKRKHHHKSSKHRHRDRD